MKSLPASSSADEDPALLCQAVRDRELTFMLELDPTLYLYVLVDDIQKLLVLLESGRWNPNSLDESGDTPLTLAIGFGTVLLLPTQKGFNGAPHDSR